MPVYTGRMIAHIRILTFSFFVLVGLVLLAHQNIPSALSDDQYIAVVTINDVINNTNAKYLSRSIKKATNNRAALILVRLDTPGGTLKSTRDMVNSILNSEVPVAVHVHPSGAHAASAGTFITAAANFAVMSPGTNIGAASPVSGSGKDLSKTLDKKINEDVKAFIRSIADVRNRNTAALEATITEAKSYSAEEAVNLGVVDFIARDSDLINRLDGMTAETTRGTVVLDLDEFKTREIKRTWLEHFLGIIDNPNLALIFIAMGFLGILIELIFPGLYGPGIMGALLSGLAIAGMGQIGPNWVGIGFIGFGVLLVVMETQIQESEHQIMGIGGVLAFIIGLFLIFGGFFSTPSFPEVGSKASWWLLGSVSGTLILLVVGFLYLARPTGSTKAYMSDPNKTTETIIGTAVSDLSPAGTVLVDGVEWPATTNLSQLIKAGEEVIVEGTYGGMVKVSKSASKEPPKKRKLFGRNK